MNSLTASSRAFGVLSPLGPLTHARNLTVDNILLNFVTISWCIADSHSTLRTSAAYVGLVFQSALGVLGPFTKTVFKAFALLGLLTISDAFV